MQRDHETIMSSAIRSDVSSLFKISFPVMLSTLSTHIMMFLDRVILVRYDLEAMNSAAASMMSVAVFQCGAMGVAAISEVFVGRHNGAKELTAVGSAVWQMIWFSMMLFVVSVPIAIYGSALIIPQELAFYGVPYFKWIMAFSPLAAVGAAFSGFYIGVGKTHYITLSVVVGNIVNIVLAVILIFGIQGFVPSFGIRGAAFASIIGALVQCLLLCYWFLKSKNRLLYHTMKWRIYPLVMWQEIKMGGPQALGHAIEVTAWAFTFHLVAPLGMAFVTVLTVCQSVILTIYFMLEGLQKGVIGVASNLIGAKKLSEIKILLKSSLKLYIVILFIIAIPMLVVGKQLVVAIFITDHKAIELINQVTIGLRWMFLFCVFDGLVWIFSGIIVAGGDTKFVMLVNAANTWLFSIVPLYFLTKVSFIEPHMMSLFTALYALINAMCFALRYKSLGWLKVS